ncbi:MAG: histidinol-phosphate transaminase [Burkholderiaceae bacterium]|nr:MAG: histidinol-phosphate transaminase [Burkholderiaceae bacterium]
MIKSEKFLPWVADMPAYSLGRSYTDVADENRMSSESVVKLASNENPYGCSPLVKKFLKDGWDQLNRYPDSDCFELKKKLSEKNNVELNQIFLGNGSNEILDYIARVFLTSGRHAIYSRYCFAVYPLIVKATGAEAIVAEADESLGHDLNNFISSFLPSVSVIFIANPNNPTGTYLSFGEIKNFLQKIDSSVVVVLDEAYFEYSRQKENSAELVSLFPNLIITRSFSKAYGLAALRVGYAISSEKVIAYMNRVRQPFNINSIAQKAACIALEDNSFVKESVSRNDANKCYLEDCFREIGIPTIKSMGNFILANVRSFTLVNGREVPKAGTQLANYLLKTGVITRPVDNYNLYDWLRITVGTELENKIIVGALHKLKEHLS